MRRHRHGRRHRRRYGLIRRLAIGVLLAQLAGCSSCVDETKKEEAPVVSQGGAPVGTRSAKITDRRPVRIPIGDAGSAD